MRNVNKAIVMAYYAVILKLNNFPHGGSITAFSVVTTKHWKDKNPRRTQTGYRMAQNCHQQPFSRDCQ